MIIDIECVFELHLNGSDVQPGEEPRAKREWVEGLEANFPELTVEELPLSPNGNYEFRLRASDREVLQKALEQWYFRDQPEEAKGYLEEFMSED